MSANCSVVGIARGRKDQKQNEAMAVIVTQRRSLWEVARQVKCQMDAGEDADTLAKELLAWLLEVADQPMPNPNRCLVEIPDTFAVAHWPRDAEVAKICPLHPGNAQVRASPRRHHGAAARARSRNRTWVKGRCGVTDGKIKLKATKLPDQIRNPLHCVQPHLGAPVDGGRRRGRRRGHRHLPALPRRGRHRRQARAQRCSLRK